MAPTRLPELPLVCLKSANCHTTLDAFVGKNTVIGEEHDLNPNKMHSYCYFADGLVACLKGSQAGRSKARREPPFHHSAFMLLTNTIVHLRNRLCPIIRQNAIIDTTTPDMK